MKRSPLYLKCLRMNNLATFQEQEIHFSQNFNAIVGETGSGKSLIMEALQLLFGQRADKKLIRKDAEYAMIEAEFQANDQEIKSFLNELGYPFEDCIVIKRIIYTSGTTKNFLNHQNCTLNELSLFSKRFIDFVGQFENQKLLSAQYQLKLLDSYIDKIKDRSQIEDFFLQIQQLSNSLNKILIDDQNRIQRVDFLKFQLLELENINPNPQEEVLLLEKKDKILNFEKRTEVINSLLEIFSESSNYPSINELLANSLKIAQKNSSILTAPIIDKIAQAQTICSEISYNLTREHPEIENDDSIEEILNKLDQYQKIKRKYGQDLNLVSEKFNEMKQELLKLENIESSIADYQLKIKNISSKAYALADALHHVRVTGAKNLSKKLTEDIRKLNMKEASISIQVNRSEQLLSSGLSNINFLTETNPGEGFHSIKDIASGGELSRILLAIRKVLSAKDSISIFFFDEIDAGIGGETALTIGKNLAEISENSQVIAITHLPQIASQADKLIVVNKDLIQQGDQKRTTSKVREVSGNNKKVEVRSMSPTV